MKPGDFSPGFFYAQGVRIKAAGNLFQVNMLYFKENIWRSI